MKPCRLCRCSGREITLIWSKIHVFIHYSPLFLCSQDAGDNTLAKTLMSIGETGSTHALLMGEPA